MSGREDQNGKKTAQDEERSREQTGRGEGEMERVRIVREGKDHTESAGRRGQTNTNITTPARNSHRQDQ